MFPVFAILPSTQENRRESTAPDFPPAAAGAGDRVSPHRLSLQDKVDRSLYLLHYVTILGAMGDDWDLRRLGFFRSEAAPGIGNRRLGCTPRGIDLMT